MMLCLYAGRGRGAAHGVAAAVPAVPAALACDASTCAGEGSC